MSNPDTTPDTTETTDSPQTPEVLEIRLTKRTVAMIAAGSAAATGLITAAVFRLKRDSDLEANGYEVVETVEVEETD